MARFTLTLLALAASLLAQEGWSQLEAEWRDALARYERAREAAATDAQRERLEHPFVRFGERLRARARVHANTPEAGPPLVEIALYTPDEEERLQALVRLRESHLRSERLGALVPDLVLRGDPQSLRTLADIAQGSPHPEVRARAGLGLYEARRLGVGMRAPEILGEDARGRPVRLAELEGKVVVLFAALEPTDACVESWRACARALADRPVVVLAPVAAAAATPSWRSLGAGEATARRWNALERPRVFVIDRRGVLRAKDLEHDALTRAVEDLLVPDESD